MLIFENFNFLVLKIVRLWFGKMNFFNKRDLLYSKPSKLSLNFHPNLLKWQFYHFECKIFLFSKSNKSILNKNGIYTKQYIKSKANLILEKEIFFFIQLAKIFYREAKPFLFQCVFFLKNKYFLIFKIRNMRQNFNFTQVSCFDKISSHLNYKKLCIKLNNLITHIRDCFYKSRIDFRKLETISIDPSGTIDIDDLLHYRFLKNSIIHEVGLHVPDIYPILSNLNDFFYLIKEKNNSIFLKDKKLNLFPRIFSKNCFSFNQYIDRLSFSTIFLFDLCGKLKKIKLTRSIIKNRRFFTEIRISENVIKFKKLNNNKKGVCFFSKKIILIKNICLKLKSSRLKLKGETTFQGNLKSFSRHKKTIFWGNLNEELINLSNLTIAEKILNFFPNSTKLRRLNSIKLNKFSRIFQSSICFSLKLNFFNFKKSTKDIKLFVKIKKKLICSCFYKDNDFPKKVIKESILLYNNKKKDFDNLNKINWGPLYLQMSSPIRRFGDIISQKILFNIQLKKIC